MGCRQGGTGRSRASPVLLGQPDHSAATGTDAGNDDFLAGHKQRQQLVGVDLMGQGCMARPGHLPSLLATVHDDDQVCLDAVLQHGAEWRRARGHSPGQVTAQRLNPGAQCAPRGLGNAPVDGKGVQGMPHHGGGLGKIPGHP